MTAGPFRIELLSSAHDRSEFHCGEDALDRYFQTQATQDIRRRIANCFVVLEGATGRVAAYFSLSASSISVVNLPPEVTKRLPRYPTLPAVRVGRLAVSLQFQGRGLGAMMLGEAALRAMRAEAAAFTLLVDAKNDSAAAFYRRHGFRPLLNQPLTLYLPLATARLALAPSGSGTAP
jgi:ribosomal protein S18 acetylase RimI-like enzyme